CGYGGDTVNVGAGGIGAHAFSFTAYGDDPNNPAADPAPPDTGPPDTLNVTVFGIQPTVNPGQVNVSANVVVYDDFFDHVNGIEEPKLDTQVNLGFGDSSGGPGGQFSMFPDPVVPGLIDFSLSDSNRYLVAGFNSADVSSVLLEPIGGNNTIDLAATPANVVTIIAPHTAVGGATPAALGVATLDASQTGDVINVHAINGPLNINDANANIRIGDQGNLTGILGPI